MEQETQITTKHTIAIAIAIDERRYIIFKTFFQFYEASNAKKAEMADGEQLYF